MFSVRRLDPGDVLLLLNAFFLINDLQTPPLINGEKNIYCPKIRRMFQTYIHKIYIYFFLFKQNFDYVHKEFLITEAKA